jgi:3-oxoacyl-[acyl-carrier-protein] synthase II
LERVVVTGIGVVSPAGKNIEDLFRTLWEEKTALTLWKYKEEGEGIPVGKVPLSDEDLHGKLSQKYDRVVLLSLFSAQQAYSDAGNPQVKPERGGVFWGIGFGGVATLLRQYEILKEKGPRRVSPYLVPAIIPNTSAGLIAQTFQLKGINLTFTNACAASSVAIGEAYEKIKEGKLDLAIAGGGEAPLTELTVAGFDNMRALARGENGCKPFGKTRSGFALGEGACALILEPLSRVISRKGKIYGEIVGYGITQDAYHITDPDPVGKSAEKAILMALREGGITPKEVGYVNAHATGTYKGDQVEAEIFLRLFQDHPEQSPWISSTKGITGHLLGGAGSLEAAITLLALKTGVLPPNLPWDSPPFPLKFVKEPIQVEVEYALSTSFGFGGINSCLLFRRGPLDLYSNRENSTH